MAGSAGRLSTVTADLKRAVSRGIEILANESSNGFANE